MRAEARFLWALNPGQCQVHGRARQGLTLGCCAVAHAVAEQAAKVNCEACSVLKLHPKTAGTEKLDSMNSFSSALEELGATVFHSLNRGSSLHALLEPSKSWTESRNMDYR